MLNRIARQLTQNHNKFIAQASRCHANRLMPLTSEDMFERAATVIESTQVEVCLQFYKFYSNSIGGQKIVRAIRALQKKASPENPICVKFLINARGKLSQLLYKPNDDSGIERLADELNNENFSIVKATHTATAFGTLHSKMIISDRRRGLLLGGDPQFSNDLNAQFETGIYFEGEVCSYLYSDFLDSWQKIYRSENVRTDALCLKTIEPYLVMDKDVFVNCLLVCKNQIEFLSSLKYGYAVSPFKISVVAAILSAKYSIKTMTPNLNDPDIIAALALACAKRVTVSVSIAKHHNDTKEVYWGGTNLKSLAKLVSLVGRRHRQYIKIHWATNLKGEVVRIHEKEKLHGKFFCVDDSLVIMGSSPMDRQGLYYSREADVIFDDKLIASVFLQKIFNEKFLLGKDYYLDCCDQLIKTIQDQIVRLRSSKPVINFFSQRSKALLLQNELMEAREMISHPDIPLWEKPEALMRHMLSSLSMQSGLWSGGTTSYKSLIEKSNEYGLQYHDHVEQLDIILNSAVRYKA